MVAETGIGRDGLSHDKPPSPSSTILLAIIITTMNVERRLEDQLVRLLVIRIH